MSALRYTSTGRQATISHTIPDFPKIMRLGTTGMMEEIREELNATGAYAEEKSNARGHDPLP